MSNSNISCSSKSFIRVSKSTVGPLEQAAVSAIIGRGFLGMGPETQLFESELESYLGIEGGVVCVSSGTAALQLGLQACGIGPGDEVLVPSLTFVACFQAIAATGAVPVSCDVDEQRAFLDLNDATRRLTPSTRAIMPVHYASTAGNLDAIYEFAGNHHLRVIEDAAHAFGCKWRGRRVGSFGDVVCFSFDGIKNITSGEGGAVVSRNAAVIHAVQDARLLGVSGDSQKRYKCERSWDFDVTQQGWRYHMSDIMAAIGRTQLRRLHSEFAPRRCEIAARYRERMAGMSMVRFFETEPGEVIPHIQPVRILGGARDRVRQALLDAGIQVGIHYKPNHLLTKFGAGSPHLPITEQLYKEILTIPLHPELSFADVDNVIGVMERTLRKNI